MALPRALTCLLAPVAKLGDQSVTKRGARVKEGCRAGSLVCGGVVWCQRDGIQPLGVREERVREVRGRGGLHQIGRAHV